MHAQHPLVRRLLGRKRLNSITYQRIMRWNSRWGVTRAIDRLRGLHSESVIQDVDIPLDRAAEFLDFLHREIGILPIWMCPIRAPRSRARDSRCIRCTREPIYVNFGFWDVVTRREARPAGLLSTARSSARSRELGGIKSLYSDSYYTEDEFWSVFDRGAYAELKARYDPAGALPDLYGKCVRGAAIGGALSRTATITELEAGQHENGVTVIR